MKWDMVLRGFALILVIPLVLGSVVVYMGSVIWEKSHPWRHQDPALKKKR